jgi:hypothetical protein
MLRRSEVHWRSAGKSKRKFRLRCAQLFSRPRRQSNANPGGVVLRFDAVLEPRCSEAGKTI